VSDVTFERSRRTAVIAWGASDADVVANTVTETLADGIHLTNGSRDSRVFNNHVHFTGDDLIALVSPRESPVGTPHAIGYRNTVFQNVCNYNFKGRGLTIIGGDRMALENNRVMRTMGSNLKIAAEEGFRSYEVIAALARGNVLTDSRGAHDANSDGMPKFSAIIQSAIYVLGYESTAGHFAIMDSRIIGNTVARAAVDGFKAESDVINLTLLDNDFSAINTTNQAGKSVIHLFNFDGVTSVLVKGNVFHSAVAGGTPAAFITNGNPGAETNVGYGTIFVENYTDGPDYPSTQDNVTVMH
jgi:hypothetical protein